MDEDTVEKLESKEFGVGDILDELECERFVEKEIEHEFDEFRCCAMSGERDKKDGEANAGDIAVVSMCTPSSRCE